MRKFIGFLAFVVLVVVGAGAGLWHQGGRTYVVNAETLVAATPDEAFPYLSEPQLVSEWVQSFVEGTSTSDERGEGAEAKFVAEEQGIRTEVLEKVTRYEPARAYECTLNCDYVEITNSYELFAQADGTEVKQVLKAKCKGVARILMPLIGSSIKQRLDEDLARLKETLDGPSSAEPSDKVALRQ
ncbi:MAG: SRPBCC family protein [Pirellulaceae bacterium]|nr:SRPBCC family protein [Planctomycetales bacterium]